MRTVKKYLLLAVVLCIYIGAVWLLLHYFYMYQKAYYGLSMLIAHPSIERNMSEGESE